MTPIRPWLESQGLGDYAELFERERIDLETLRHVSDAELKELGLPMGPRVRLRNALEAPADAPPRDETPAASGRHARAERRQLTVMFCDLVGSTSLAEALDPEELRELMRAYQETCGAAVARYAGHVAQYLGDGLMVYFGWPQAHEDDAERAVRAALDIVQDVKKVAAPAPMQVRVGIATGPVVVGETGAGDASIPKVAVGETPNLASRVQGLAQPDEIVIAATTQRLVGQAFELHDLGEQALRGILEPVRAYRVLAAGSAEDRFAARRGRSAAPLVGRDSELALLEERWRQALDGEGQVVVLSGEAGIGKSRIARSLRGRLEPEAHAFLSYQCSPFFANTAFHPVIEHLKRAAGFLEEEPAESKLGKLEALLERSGGAAPDAVPMMAALLSLPTGERYAPLELSPAQRKERTIALVTEHVLYLAQAAPVLALFEDAHWIDPSTRELLDRLVARVADARVMLIVTHRPELDARWGAHAHITVHSLNRLSRRQCAQLAGDVAPKPLPEAVLAQIIEKTDGVPLFVEELTKAVLESELLVDAGGRYELRGELEALRIPATLHDSLVARLDRLLPVKEIAQIGAAIGREFSYELLAAVAPLPEAELERALESFVRSELVYRRGAGPQAVYVFKHALVQDAAYDSLLKRKRAELHARIAQAIETRFPDKAETEPELVAHHYSAAGAAQRALPHWLRAGRNATARAAYREAAAHLARGLHLLEGLTPGAERDALELQLLLESGEAQLRGGESTQAMRDFERAAELARTLRESESLARAASGFAEASWRPGLPDETPVRLLLEANRVLGEADSETKVKVLAWLAVALEMTGAAAEAEAASQQAEAMAERVAIPVSVMAALARRPGARREMAWVEAHTARAQRAAALARQTGEMHSVLEVLPTLINSLARLGDMPGARQRTEEMAPLAEQERQPFYTYSVISSRAAVAFFEGRFAECEALAQQAFAAGESLRGLDAAGLLGVQMFSLRREQGRLAEVAPLLRQFVQTNPAESAWRPGLALMYAELGMLAEARAELEHLARDAFAGIPEDASWLNCMAMLAEVCHAVADTAHANTLYQLMHPHAGGNVVAPPLVACYGAMARHLGLLATTMRRWEDAERHYEAALELNARQGGRPWVAHTQHAYAGMLLARGEAGERAAALNAAALATARELGMQGLAARAAALQERLGA
jgi:class 3 adenylate cyclase/tetratricopeptide (TPR) repeat protein/ABC-type transport system involved in cytochrome c biogenesis ATPase subunit